MIWTLSKFGLTSNLRRVPDEKILLAEMREARRQAETMAELEKETPISEKASELLHSFSQRLTDSYNELEQAMADKVEVSRKAMDQWQQETRELIRHIASIKRRTKGFA